MSIKKFLDKIYLSSSLEELFRSPSGFHQIDKFLFRLQLEHELMLNQILLRVNKK